MVSGKLSGLSTSPQASVLQLNYPLISGATTATVVSAAAVAPPTVHSSFTHNTHSSVAAALSSTPALSLTPTALTVSSPSLTLSSSTAALLSSALPQNVVALPGSAALPVIATKAVTPGAAPALLKLGTTPNSRNDSIAK